MCKSFNSIWVMFFVSVLLCTNAPAFAAEQKPPTIIMTRSLPDLEAEMKQAPEILIAAADLDEKMNRLDHIQTRSGLSLRGTAGASHNRELSGINTTRDYNTVMVGGGIRYPLLGLYEKNKIDIATAAARVWESRHRLDLARIESLKTLRNHYIDYWGSQKKIILSQAFVSRQKEVEKILANRTEKGLMLEADHQEFLTTFALVQRNIFRMQAIQKRSLRIISLMTQPGLGPFIPELPFLPEPCKDMTALQSMVVNTHPDIRLYRSLVDEQLGILGLNPMGSLDAYVDLGGYASREDAADHNEYGLALNLTVTLPADFHRANQAQRRAMIASLKKIQLELDQKTALILADAESALLGMQSEAAHLQFANQRLHSALESLREALLRSEKLPGDTLEKLEQARYQYYLSAMDLVDARMSVFFQQVQLLQYSSSGCDTVFQSPEAQPPDFDSILNDNFLNPLWLQKMPQISKFPDHRLAAHAPDKVEMGYGAYVWNTRRLPMEDPENDLFWQMLKDQGLTRLLISFDRKQLEELNTAVTRHQLKMFLETAHIKKIRVDLLLGEPLWILPEYRPDLLSIIYQLSDLPFWGLHLDLEPNQLDESLYNETFLLAQLIRTLQVVKTLSPWPVGISLHPRYLDSSRTHLCLGTALTHLGLDELTLMVYVTQPEKVSQIVQPLMEKFPGLRISVAQSVETVLSIHESYAQKGRTNFNLQMVKLKQIMSHENFNGILIQSYSEYKEMKP